MGHVVNFPVSKRILAITHQLLTMEFPTEMTIQVVNIKNTTPSEVTVLSYGNLDVFWTHTHTCIRTMYTELVVEY